MPDIGPKDGTPEQLRILADRIENGNAPDFFIVVSSDLGVESAIQDLIDPLRLLGAVEIKLHEYKADLMETKEPV